MPPRDNNVTAHSIYDWMRGNGLECDDRIEFDGRIHRFVVGGGKRGKKNGWYWFAERNGRVYGTAGNWKTQHSVSIGRDAPEFRALKVERAKTDEDLARKAEIKANEEWAGLANTGTSAYLTRKQVAPFGVRFGKDYIAVPMTKEGKIIGLQRIYDDGRKRFTYGCAKRGAVHVIPGNGVTAFVEGYATGASVRMAIGATVIVTFDCGNLIEVAKSHRHKLPEFRRPLVCADNDLRTPGNPGVTHGREATSILSGKIVFPPAWMLEDGGTDWNDVHVTHGIQHVADQIYEAL